MNIIKNIESLGYKISKGALGAHSPYPLTLTLPSGETKALDGSLGRTVIIGGKVETTLRELIQTVYELSDEEMIAYEYCYDKRTHDYLNSVKSHIGLINVSSGTEYFGEKIIENETTKGYEVNFANASGRISKVDNNFVVQILMSIGDDIGVDTFTFNKYPSSCDFKTAWKLNECQIKFRDHEYPITYECWECGKKLHWLDVKGSFTEKIEHLEDRYCGC